MYTFENIKNIKIENEQKYDRAVQIMKDESNLNTTNRVAIIRLILDSSSMDIPHVEYVKGKFKSSFIEISHYQFDTEEEMNLVNAMYIAQKEQEVFDKSNFVHDIKATFRILGIRSNWA